MLCSIFTAIVAASAASAHLVLTYPGQRGNSLITNETWPYGMQWEYPCTSAPSGDSVPRHSPLASKAMGGRHEAILTEKQAEASARRRTGPTGPRRAAL